MIPQNVLEGFGNMVEWNIQVPVSKLVINEKPYSRGIEKRRVAQRKKSLQKYGWFPNMKIFLLPDVDGLYIILDGNHRVKGLKELGCEEMEVPATIIDPYDYIKEAELFMLLNQDSPVLGSLAWWRGMKEAGDIVASTVWKLDSDPDSNLCGKVKTKNTKSRPFTIPTVCTIIKYIACDSTRHYTRGRHKNFQEDIIRLSYPTILEEVNKYVTFVEEAFFPHDTALNKIPYETMFQRGIMRFYVLLKRNNRLSGRDYTRTVKQVSKVNLKVVKRDGLDSGADFSRILLTKWNEGLMEKNRLSFEEHLTNR